MCPDDKKQTWGTIYLDASRESTLEKIDAMQAASRREQAQKHNELEYLERVRAKATERAKEILGEAYTERQKVLEEARQEAERLRQEAEGQYALAAAERQESQRQLEAAQEELRQAESVREAAHGEGFNAGLEQAQQELEDFRAAMGASVAGVLSAIHGQCGTIFEGWRQEMVELLKVCVERGTGLVLDEQYPLVLEHLVMEAVRQLDDRRCITLRVHPDDEAAVADMFAAARERLPNIGQWIVSGDPALQLGGLIAESQSGTVDSRLELFSQLVDNILQHLVLPASSLDNEAERAVAEAVRQEAAKIALLAPPSAQAEAEEALPEVTEQAETPLLPEPLMESAEEDMPAMPSPPDDAAPTAQSIPNMDSAPLAEPEPEALVEAALAQAEMEAQAFQQAAVADPAMPSAAEDMPGEAHWQNVEVQEPTADAPPPLEDEAQPLPVPGQSDPQHPTRDELEHELFDLPPTQQDEVLAQGGFLDAPADSTEGAHKS